MLRSLILGAILLSGCAQKPSSVEGDVFLTMRSGDVKRGGGVAVRLLGKGDSVGYAQSQICDSLGPSRKRLYEKALRLRDERSADSVRTANTQIWLAMLNFLSANTVQQSKADVMGHFRFDAVPPGSYRLFAEWDIGSEGYQFWTQPIYVKAGQQIRKDLENSVEAGDAFYCGWK